MILKNRTETCTGCESVRIQVTPKIKADEELARYGSRARRVFGPIRYSAGDKIQTVSVMEDKEDGSIRYTCPLLVRRNSPVGFKTRCEGSKTYAPCRFEVEIPREDRGRLTDLWETSNGKNILVVRKTPIV